MEQRQKYRAIESLARIRNQYFKGSEYDKARRHLNDCIRELREIWDMQIPTAGKDVTDFFTYETAERPDWLKKKHRDSDK